MVGRIAQLSALLGGALLLVNCSSGNPSGCTSNTQCPAGQYCGENGACTFDCQQDSDCPGGTCNSIGKCAYGDDGGRRDGAADQQVPDFTWPDGPGVDTAPDSGVDTAPDSGVDTAPDVGVDTAPDVGVDTAPDVGVDLGHDLLGPDTVPAWDSDICSTAQPLSLASGLASVNDTTSTAQNDMVLPAEGCTGTAEDTPGRDRFYAVNLEGGKLYEVTLTPAASFDPALYVITDCADTSTCQPGMGSDRLGDGVVEQLVLAPEINSAMTIVVDAFAAGEHGSYTLQVKEINPPQANSACGQATQLSFSAVYNTAKATGTTRGANNDVTLPAVSCTGAGDSTPGPDLFYSFYADAGWIYMIYLKPADDFDPALAVFKQCTDVAGSCEPGMGSDTIGAGKAELVTLAPQTSGTYRVMVDSWSANDKGGFRLLIRRYDNAVFSHTDCTNPVELTLAGGRAQQRGDTGGADDTVELTASDCTGYSTPGPELFFSFDALAGRQYEVKVTPASGFDPSLYVFTSCGDVAGTCGAQMGSDDGLSGEAETVTFTAASSGEHLIGVDSFFDAGNPSGSGTFQLDVKELGVATCGPGNCSGCCAGNLCVDSPTDQQCGSGGEDCVACGTGRTCSGGSCVFDDDAWWRVVGYSATISGTWDPAGPFVLPDPYLDVTISGIDNQTSVKQDTANPLWDNALLDAKALAIKASVDVEVWDSDFDADDLIGSCTPTVSEADLLSGFKTFVCGSASVTLHFFAL